MSTDNSARPTNDPLELRTKHGWASRLGIDPGVIDTLVARRLLRYVLLPNHSRRLFMRSDVEAALDGLKRASPVPEQTRSSRARVGLVGSTKEVPVENAFAAAVARTKRQRAKRRDGE